MTPCTCPSCCEQARRDREERVRRARERRDSEKRDAYRRKHGEDPTVTMLRKMGLLP